MLPFLSAFCVALATWLWSAPRTPADRLTRLLPPPTPSAPPSSPTTSATDTPTQPDWLDKDALHRPPDRRTITTAALTGVITALLIGGFAGIAVALLLTPATALILHRREPPHSRQEREQITADLPFAADLMTACLLAGQPVTAATDLAATTIGGPLGQRLAWVSSQLRLGADPEPTWATLTRDPALSRLSRAMSRAAQTGAPLADVLTRLADDARDAARAASLAAARTVGVKAVAPLGLCFLPAFVLLGIIPVIAGLASTIILP
ncbi:type II secretion system F family protein [Nonomuraea sp. NPDC049607]|uniref:type II secretion system F family protein n=1 Tax=Nonomuraea sp. NPDC049607 TaxID=3154732 RepID=UPI0034317148